MWCDTRFKCVSVNRFQVRPLINVYIFILLNLLFHVLVQMFRFVKLYVYKPDLNVVWNQKKKMYDSTYYSFSTQALFSQKNVCLVISKVQLNLF